MMTSERVSYAGALVCLLATLWFTFIYSIPRAGRSLPDCYSRQDEYAATVSSVGKRL
jgi:hypothetical protein